jgi:SAM-dependent methyltransferase
MAATSEQASIELRVNWQHAGTRHSNRQYFEKFNFWRDILPGALSLQLPDSQGEWISESFAPGELVAPWSERNIHRVKRSALKLQRRHGPPVRLFRGRHYPRYIAAGTADIFAENMQPLRIQDMDDDTVTLDLNHPLARLPLAVSARIDQRLGRNGEHGGRCNDAVMEIFRSGAGLEILPESGTTEYFSAAAFARMDPRDDAQFYRQPRLVQHIDATAIANLGALYGRLVQAQSRVLDLMSSWVSHLPESLTGLQVTGLGMNAEELAQNPRLDTRVVHDLNVQPHLPFANHEFDAAICSVSIEYLTEPVAVVRDLARVLRPGAPLIITFSDRWFPTKAIALWNDLHPFERVALVQEYFRAGGGFESLATETIRGYPRPADDKYADQLPQSDPVFAVWGHAQAD